MSLSEAVRAIIWRLLGRRPLSEIAPQGTTRKISIDQDQLDSISQRLDHSIGNQVEWVLEFMSMNYYVFEVNYHELSDYLQLKSKPAEWLSDLLPLIKEVLRLLLNFLGSSKALIDLTRATIETRFEDEEVRLAYQNKVEEVFANDPLTGFIQDLRNYLIHRTLPFVLPDPDISKDENDQIVGFSMPFSIAKTQLQDWDGWSSRGHVFLKESDDPIRLAPIVDTYYSRVSHFHSWLHLTIRDHYEAELEELESITAELNRLLMGIGKADEDE